MLELDARTRRPQRHEPDLDLGIDALVVLPIARTVARQHEPPRRIPDQHPSPVALAAIGRTLDPSPTSVRVDDRGLRRRAADVVSRERPPSAMFAREHVERTRLA